MTYFAQDRGDGDLSRSKLPPAEHYTPHPEEARLLKEDGWSMRVYSKSSCNHAPADFRTTGLSENSQHLDLQIYYPLPAFTAFNRLYTVVNLIKGGTVFTEGMISEDVLDGYSVKFIKATCGGKEYLRIILPDKNGCFEEGKMAHPYSLQYKDREM